MNQICTSYKEGLMRAGNIQINVVIYAVFHDKSKQIFYTLHKSMSSSRPRSALPSSQNIRLTLNNLIIIRLKRQPHLTRVPTLLPRHLRLLLPNHNPLPARPTRRIS